jgi:polyisoprenoid-binding protein YceI
MVQAAEKWGIDFSHSKIGFSVRHFGITETDGFFKSASASIITSESDFSDAEVEIEIDANSINTNDEQRDAHLKSPDFFETEKYPQILFKSTGVERVNGSNLKLHGNLTIKETTNPVTFEMEFMGIVPKDPFGNTKAGLVLQGKINRKDFGLVWNVALDHGGIAVSEIVKIYCPVQLLKLQ